MTTDSRAKPQYSINQDLQRRLDSGHHHHQHQHHQLHHHADGPTTAPATSAPAQSQNQNQNQNHLEAANIAHFDALGHDFDKQNPFSAEFADRLSRALRRLSRSNSASAGADSSSSSSS